MGCSSSILTNHELNDVRTSDNIDTAGTNATINNENVSGSFKVNGCEKGPTRRTNFSCLKCLRVSNIIDCYRRQSTDINSNANRCTSSDGKQSRRSSSALSIQDLSNRALLRPLDIKDEADCDKALFIKKDSIITLGSLKHAVMMAARGTAASSIEPSTEEEVEEETKSIPNNSFIQVIDDQCIDGPGRMDLKQSAIRAPQVPLRGLFIFQKLDYFTTMVQQLCNRYDIDIMVSKNESSAVEKLTTSTEDIHVIFLDTRYLTAEKAEETARSIRMTEGHRFTSIIGIIQRNYYDNIEFIYSLFNAGINSCLVENRNAAVCCIEMRMILISVVRLNHFLSTQQVVYTALNRTKDGVIITDNFLNIQYMNKVAERMLDLRFDALRDRPIDDVFVSEISQIKELWRSKTFREYQDALVVDRKNTNGITTEVRVLPYACFGSQPTHYIFEINNVGFMDAGYRSSLERRSITSDIIRPLPATRLSATFESPLSKVINLFTQIQKRCSHEENRLIDKVMEILKREALFMPVMKDLRLDDPTTKDLIGAFLGGHSGNPYSTGTNVKLEDIYGDKPRYDELENPEEMRPIKQLLTQSLYWDFDIFKLEEITGKRPLMYLGLHMFKKFHVFETLNVEECTCRNWLATIESYYHADNTYHNSTHAADVMQATGVFLDQFALKDMAFTRFEEAAALIAAAAHDIDHPGRSSIFLSNSDNPLAILYNDITVLESHHAALTFRLTLNNESLNIFKNLDKELYKTVRANVVDMILATEMTRHFEHLAKFVAAFGSEAECKDVNTDEENSALVRRMLIKVADVSNPVRPPVYCVEWGRRIAEEYFDQTDEEKEKKLPVVMPMFDRNTCSIPKSQIGFIEFIIKDMVHAWDGYIEMPELIAYLESNYNLWKQYEDQGVRTLADVKRKQISLRRKKNSSR